ncbi:MAG: asparagine synthase (glutamine-hydrolyzing) [Patescibacteria group bacterium]|nr:asparagine synthase (glutamine-hydrolyzing) [Patescibacteria group bacterium]
MCGILSVAGNSAQKYAGNATARAIVSLSKRGPDDHGTLAFPHCILAQTRLSIIDLSGGHQPMRDNARAIAITFNGEIYNYRELKKELESKGYHFSTNSDTEVILKSYIEYGTECPKYLDGMFSFALWDEEKQSLFMARDRFGKKPLYYAFDTDKNLVVASEIKALEAAGITGVLDRQALDNYLQLMYIPPWKSVYGNVSQLPPAHSAVYRKGELNIKRYWNIPFQPLSISYDEAKEEVRRLLSKAVEKRMLAADVEVGALLSGGVDSTIVSIFASKYLDHPLKTFSLGYGDYINELPYAKQASDYMRSEHYTAEAGGDMTEELEKVLAYFDEPHADSSDFPQHLISELAASKVKVALSGDGGDEIFMGYGWHTRHLHLSYRAHTFEKLFLNPFQGRTRSQRVFSPLQRLALWGSLSPMNNDIYTEDAYRAGLDPMQKITTFDLSTYLPGQLLSKVDRTSMMHGLEVRSPFLDTALVEFVINLPTEFKSGKDGGKIILKDLLSEWMPGDFAYRRKQGFGAPVGKWLREPKMRGYATQKLGDGARIRSLFVGKTIDFLLNDFYGKNYDRFGLKLWLLLCLEIWLERHSEK